MALVKCSECGRDISDKAVACPGCGVPLQQAPSHAEAEAPNQRVSLNAIDKEKILSKGLASSGAKGGFIGGGFAGALGGALGGYIAGKFMSTEMVERDIVCYYDYQTTIVLFKAGMMGLGGKPIDTSSIKSHNEIIARTVGESTFVGAQAVMSVEFYKSEAASTRVLISCAAKDSMFNKNVASKFIDKILKNTKYKLTEH